MKILLPPDAEAIIASYASIYNRSASGKIFKLFFQSTTRRIISDAPSLTQENEREEVQRAKRNLSTRLLLNSKQTKRTGEISNVRIPETCCNIVLSPRHFRNESLLSWRCASLSSAVFSATFPRWQHVTASDGLAWSVLSGIKGRVTTLCYEQLEANEGSKCKLYH